MKKIKISVKTRHILTVASFAMAIISLVAAGGITLAYAYQNRVLPLTYVAGQAIGGAKASDATATVSEAAQNYASQPVTLQLNGQTAQVNLGDLGVTINANQTSNAIVNDSSTWDWVSYSYWQNFFQKKNVGLTYSINTDQLEKQLQTKFTLAKAPQNATISFANNDLTVQPGISGATFDLSNLKTEMAMYLAGQGSNTFTVNAIVSDPAITTASANQTKTTVDQAVTPIYLTGAGQSFTIQPASILPLISFTANDTSYTWQIDQIKLASYIDSTVGKKLNIGMVQKIIQSDSNNTVTTQGSDGRQVSSKTLATSVVNAITQGINTKSSPISIPLNTVAFTTKTVNPVYSLGTYPGLYIDVSLAQQKLTIINGTNVIAQYTTSTGAWNTPTPTGTLYIFNKIKEAYSPEFYLWMPDWNGLAPNPDGTGYDGYGIHGIVCWDKACTNREGANHIGTPVSHGCIRVDDAGIAYIYDNVPTGTPVVIHN